jgi:hypothetical protein
MWMMVENYSFEGHFARFGSIHNRKFALFGQTLLFGDLDWLKIASFEANGDSESFRLFGNCFQRI